ncbi:hypothetical protein SAMN04488516_11725 [Desulfonauticus submarinus]|uniref:Haemolysin XhlA n=1 Tax=Desulfonauticus submarinus TaxID=206665 RepID=A0A1H0GAE4_9BACT|nr:hypothetical protein [Desulfonauticus submarinus]SDO03885.1 hypothetical protein SAMN04488516_11725 [Desulfonauticus submarinus]
MAEKDLLEKLGEHTGILQGIQNTLNSHTQKLNTIDDRLREVEIKSAKNGLISGAIISTIINAGMQFFGIKS